jgi:hypothetical protein
MPSGCATNTNTAAVQRLHGNREAAVGRAQKFFFGTMQSSKNQFESSCRECQLVLDFADGEARKSFSTIKAMMPFVPKGFVRHGKYNVNIRLPAVVIPCAKKKKPRNKKKKPLSK